MRRDSLTVIWRPDDAKEVFERAATFQAVLAATAPVVDLFTRKAVES